MVSALTGIPVRADVAMTGEITLRGEVLLIGGLKEKLLAAHRGGIKTVLIPEENVKDLAEIPDNVKNRLDIHPVKWIDQVLEMALERKPEALSDEQERNDSVSSRDARTRAGGEALSIKLTGSRLRRRSVSGAAVQQLAVCGLFVSMLCTPFPWLRTILRRRIEQRVLTLTISKRSQATGA